MFIFAYFGLGNQAFITHDIRSHSDHDTIPDGRSHGGRRPESRVSTTGEWPAGAQLAQPPPVRQTSRRLDKRALHNTLQPARLRHGSLWGERGVYMWWQSRMTRSDRRIRIFRNIRVFSSVLRWIFLLKQVTLIFIVHLFLSTAIHIVHGYLFAHLCSLFCWHLYIGSINGRRI